jgi:hypothetical protein
MSIKKSLLYLLPVISLALLPMQGLMANLLYTGHVNTATQENASAHLSVDGAMDATLHQHGAYQASPNLDNSESCCHDTACGACAPMAVVFVKMRANLLKGVDVYRRIHVPLSAVFLASEIRPPIS